MTTSVGAALVSILTDDQYEIMAQFIQRYGADGVAEARRQTARAGCWPPLLSIIPANFLDGDECAALIAGLRVRVAGLLTQSSSVEDWATAFIHIGVDGSLAHDIASRVVTPDVSMKGVVLNMFSYLPSIFGGSAANAAGVAAGWIQQLLPQMWFDRSNDEIYTILRAGREAKEMYLKAALCRAEIKAETPQTDPNNPGAVTNSQVAASHQLMDSLLGAAMGWVIAPWAGPFSAALGGLMGHQMGSGATGAGLPAPPALNPMPAGPGAPPPPPPPMLPAGDFELGDVEQGLPDDVRRMAVHAMYDIGDFGFPTQENGGFATWIKHALAKADPVYKAATPHVTTAVGGSLGGPVGHAMASTLSPELTSRMPPEHAPIAAVLRQPIAHAAMRHGGNNERVKQLMQAKGKNATLQELLNALGQ